MHGLSRATVCRQGIPYNRDTQRPYPPMDFSNPTTLLISTGIAALVMWRIYRRVRRMVGRQRLSSVRPWLTVTFFPLLVALLLHGAVRYPAAALGLVCGALVGVALGWYGIRVTKFERTSLGLFYTPNAHLGIALSLLLLGRLVFRAIELYSAAGSFSGSFHTDSGSFARSPLTLLIFGSLAGYYVSYAAGLLRWKYRDVDAVPDPTTDGARNE